MKNFLKWVFAIGALLAGLVFVSLLVYTFFDGSPFIRYGMMGFRHSRIPFSSGSPFGWLMIGSILLLVVFGGLSLIFSPRVQAVRAPGDPSRPLEVCPGCGEGVNENWKFCPYCDYDLA